jgi:hypothetical protein
MAEQAVRIMAWVHLNATDKQARAVFPDVFEGPAIPAMVALAGFQAGSVELVSSVGATAAQEAPPRLCANSAYASSEKVRALFSRFHCGELQAIDLLEGVFAGSNAPGGPMADRQTTECRAVTSTGVWRMLIALARLEFEHTLSRRVAAELEAKAKAEAKAEAQETQPAAEPAIGEAPRAGPGPDAAATAAAEPAATAAASAEPAPEDETTSQDEPKARETVHRALFNIVAALLQEEAEAMAGLTASACVAMPSPTHAGSWPRAWGSKPSQAEWFSNARLRSASEFDGITAPQRLLIATASGGAGAEGVEPVEPGKVWWHYGALESLRLSISRARAAGGLRWGPMLSDLALFCKHPSPEGVAAVEACLRCCLQCVSHYTTKRFGSKKTLQLKKDSQDSTKSYMLAKMFAKVAAKEATRAGEKDPVDVAVEAARVCGALGSAGRDRELLLAKQLREKVAAEASSRGEGITSHPSSASRSSGSEPI